MKQTQAWLIRDYILLGVCIFFIIISFYMLKFIKKTDIGEPDKFFSYFIFCLTIVPLFIFSLILIIDITNLRINPEFVVFKYIINTFKGGVN